MSPATKRTTDDDLRDAVDDDERAALVAKLRRRGFVDDAEEWLGLAVRFEGFLGSLQEEVPDASCW